MKKYGLLFIMILTVLDILAICFISSGGTERIVLDTKIKSSNTVVTREEVTKKIEDKKEEPEEMVVSPFSEVETEEKVEITPEPTIEPVPDPIVYDGLTMDELSQKLERSLNSTLKGYGSLFASYSLTLGIDPYLALAITLHETGCKWTCSTLVRQCNNVGGMKGSPGCNGGSYKAFATLEEGIKSYLDNLYYNYYKYGLTTPEAMNAKYAESKDWARNVNAYISEIREK